MAVNKSLRRTIAQFKAGFKEDNIGETMERIQNHDDRYCSYTKYFSGVEKNATTAVQKCDLKYVEALTSDLFYWTYRTGHEMSQIAEPDTAIPPNASDAMTLLRDVMTQCRRLEQSPDLFPSRAIRNKFLGMVAKASFQLAEIGEGIKSRGAYEITEEEKTDCVVGAIPAFFPDKPAGKNPWNNWLDNSAKATPGWVAIQQKIPRYGDRLLRRLRLSYLAVEHHFEVNELKDSETNGQLTQIPLPGQSYTHMTWGGFTTMPLYNLGFDAGSRKKCDGNGVVTLEHLSQALFMVENEPWAYRPQRDLETSNCPYFRFAVAYKP